MTSGRWLSSWSILVVVTLIVTGLDQLSKNLASAQLGPGGDHQSVDIVSGFLQLRYVENTGAAFGILQDSTTVLVVVSFGVIGLLAALFWRMIAQSTWLGLAFGLQLGGAIGNLIDRVRLGYVVDFIDVTRFPTFNIADSGITVGAVILGIVLLLRPEVTLTPEERASGTRQVDDPVRLLRDAGDGSMASSYYDTERARDSEL